MSKHLEDQISFFLEGELRPQLHMDFLDHVSSCTQCRQAYLAHLNLLNAFNEERAEVPNAELVDAFEEMMRKEVVALKFNASNFKSLSPWLRNISKYAAVILLIVGSYLLGDKGSNNQYAKMITMEAKQNELMELLTISMLNAESASKRIKASSISKEISDPSDEVIDALISRMQNDKHINVRLAALSALSKYTMLEEVKLALLKILESETDPNMIIEVIELFTQSNGPEVLPELNNLLMKQDLPSLLRQEIQETINEII